MLVGAPLCTIGQQKQNGFTTWRPWDANRQNSGDAWWLIQKAHEGEMAKTP
jgi:hypothetical protein